MKRKDPWKLDMKKVVREAGLLRRLLAAGIDIILLIVIVINPFGGVLNNYFSDSFENNMLVIDHGIPAVIGFSLFMITLMIFLYFVLFQYYFKQTIGMMLARIKVDGKPGFWKCVIRSLIAIPTFPFYLLWIVEPALLLLGRKPVLEQLTNTRTIEQ